MNELKLKKCPFCGGPAEIVDNSRYDPGTYFVGCLYCGARSDYEHGVRDLRELLALALLAAALLAAWAWTVRALATGLLLLAFMAL
jgi:hypothetical protein